MSSGSLVTYLQDHLAGAHGALALLQHLADEDADPEVRIFAAQLHRDISQDEAILQELAAECDTGPHPIKDAIAWIGEKFSRLKIGSEGHPTSRFPLFEAWEVLSLGILGKRALWQALRTADVPAARRFDLENLIQRAQTQYNQVEQRRLDLASHVFSQASLHEHGVHP